jgi:hypothetical protein
MTLPKNRPMRGAKYAEMEVNQHFGKTTLAP